MSIRDTFEYKARWDSVGLSCGTCRHHANNDEWPNVRRDYKCGLHNLPLRVELNASGYVEGEWFCKDFEDNGKSYKPSLSHFLEIRHDLPGNILLGFYSDNGFLNEVPFLELGKYA